VKAKRPGKKVATERVNWTKKTGYFFFLFGIFLRGGQYKYKGKNLFWKEGDFSDRRRGLRLEKEYTSLLARGEEAFSFS